ncbi:MAG TPA: hypothetical protein VL371_13885 [Gemmataceae bacterium]|jgi:hypothetical protein|nr:hypothetical protein [Gemmataceae bacterium]
MTAGKALEFQAQVGADQTLRLPPEVAAEIPAGRPVRVLLLVDEVDDEAVEEAAWKRYALERFFEGYSEEDALYDRYDELSGR